MQYCIRINCYKNNQLPWLRHAKPGVYKYVQLYIVIPLPKTGWLENAQQRNSCFFCYELLKYNVEPQECFLVNVPKLHCCLQWENNWLIKGTRHSGLWLESSESIVYQIFRWIHSLGEHLANISWRFLSFISV